MLVAATAITATSQTSNAKPIKEEGICFLPPYFSFDSKPYIVCAQYDENDVYVYNDDIELVRSLNVSLPIQNYTEKRINQVRYTDEWETIDERDYDFQGGYMENLYVYDIDGNAFSDDHSFFLSQTLFNTDEKFEYVTPKYEEIVGIYNEQDNDDDGVIDHRTIRHEWKQTGINIMSEDGAVLQSIQVEPIQGEIKILKIGDKLYLWGGNRNSEGEYENVFYRIDKQSTKLERVSSMPASAPRFFSIDGRRQTRMKHGVNIVRKSDGSVSKILVK